jgi:hypothetical protein
MEGETLGDREIGNRGVGNRRIGDRDRGCFPAFTKFTM